MGSRALLQVTDLLAGLQTTPTVSVYTQLLCGVIVPCVYHVKVGCLKMKKKLDNNLNNMIVASGGSRSYALPSPLSLPPSLPSP